MKESRADQMRETATFLSEIIGATVAAKEYNRDLIAERILRELHEAYTRGFSDGIEHSVEQRMLGYEHIQRRLALMNEGR